MRKGESMEYTSDEIMNVISDITELIKEKQVFGLANTFGAAHNADQLTNNVEFWKWMGKNFDTPITSDKGAKQFAESIKQYALKKGNRNPIQGKVYEWDFMKCQRNNIKNIFSKFDAGENPTQFGIDIKETNLFTGEVKDLYQCKAYTSDGILDLKNTPKDAIVVTPEEKVLDAQQQGYKSIAFKKQNDVKKATKAKIKQAENGKAVGTYTLSNVGITMAKSGAIGAVIGISIETIASYKKWKNGELTTEQYLIEIAKSGGQYGIGGAATAGIMIPVTATITAAGMSTLIGIPIAILVGAGIDKIIAPAFGRGDYAKILSDAKYYQNITNMYVPFIEALQSSAVHFDEFISQIYQQNYEFEQLQLVNSQLNEQHEKVNKLLLDNTSLNDVIQKI